MPEDNEKKIYVTADMSIGEVVSNYPEAVAVLMKYGLHCIGCQIAAFESLRDGLVAHGLSEKDVERVVEEINATIEEVKKTVEEKK